MLPWEGPVNVIAELRDPGHLDGIQRARLT